MAFHLCVEKKKGGGDCVYLSVIVCVFNFFIFFKVGQSTHPILHSKILGGFSSVNSPRGRETLV